MADQATNPASVKAAKPAEPAPARPEGKPTPATWSTSWQLPALVAAVALLGAGLATAFMTRPKPDYEGMFEQARAAVQAEQYDDALKYLNEKVKPYRDGGVLTPEMVAEFHVLRGRSVALGEQRLGVKVESNAKTIVGEFEEAEVAGAKLEPRDTIMLADALVTLGQRDRALMLVEKLPEAEHGGRSQIIRRIVERSLIDAGADPEPALRLIAQFLSSTGLKPDDRAWALARQGELLIKRGLAESAVSKLLQTMPALMSDLAPDELADLQRVLGKAYYESGSMSDAARQLERAAAGFLESDPRWASVQALLGRIDELTGDPARARQRYEAVLSRVSEGEAQLAPTLGLAEVQSTLGDFESSLARYAEVIELMESGKRVDGVNPGVVSRSLMERHRTRLSSGDIGSALRFAELAEKAMLGETPPPDVLVAVANSHRRAGDEMLRTPDGPDRLLELERLDPATREQVRLHLVTAGKYYKRHAESLGALDNEAYGQSLWRAAESMDMAGDQDQSIPLLNDFVRFFPADPRLTEARFRLGQAYQARGDYATAADQYRALLDAAGASDNRRGTNPYADRSYVPLAQCLLLDPEPANDDEAVRLLSTVVSGRSGSVGGDQYREALVELARQRARKGEWAAAIQHLEEAASRFESAPDIDSVRYSLADAYRMDAAAIERTLSTEAMPDQQRQNLTRTRADRLTKAGQLYDQVRVGLDRKDPRRLSRLEKLQLRNSYFYLGDSAFELREFDEAIRRYDAARERYAQDPASLVAMVQIVNAYVELGDLDRAKTAQARAKRFYDSLPPASWSDPDLPMSREAWQRWLDSMAALRPLERKPEAAPSPKSAAAEGSAKHGE